MPSNPTYLNHQHPDQARDINAQFTTNGENQDFDSRKRHMVDCHPDENRNCKDEKCSADHVITGPMIHTYFNIKTASLILMADLLASTLPTFLGITMKTSTPHPPVKATRRFPLVTIWTSFSSSEATAVPHDLALPLCCSTKDTSMSRQDW